MCDWVMELVDTDDIVKVWIIKLRKIALYVNKRGKRLPQKVI